MRGPVRVLLVRTQEEARARGADNLGRLPDGRITVNVANPRAIDGLVVANWAGTKAALEHPKAAEAVAALNLALAKFRGDR